ncbi:hypothetical protein F5Y00DRAFT_251173 [Daldinia vernicosa]|uniref:uncharacterized protein n=1 Tax=Daldinia vernicosa TaxID=114800 RepID=UPI002007207C|nr:uncharacterized protein F5Y00DRAFT_251173 [Daldinia vernicosa]KAI0852597.1 hypothetical protein F5Y00DRAFT_251173 [Daldinia vernicosa]
MTDEVERLAIAPFREIVEKGNAAIENVPNADEETSPLMLKAAQNLVREGERALKRIEPLCTKNFEEYGVNFVDAIKENDEIAQFRSELEDLLWDFDDYVEPDDFDPTKFDELQKASRRAAPKIVDILKRMKLVAPAPTSLPRSPSPRSRAPSAAPDHVNNLHYGQIQIPSTSIIVNPPAAMSTEKLMEETELQLRSMMGAVAGPDEGLEANLPPRSVSDLDRRSNSHRSEVSDATSEHPPRPPSADPWQVGTAPPVSPVDLSVEGDRWERRPPVPNDSPTIPPAQPVSPLGSHAGPLRVRSKTDDSLTLTQRDVEDGRMRAASQSQGTTSDGSQSPRKRNRWTNSTQGSTYRSHSGFTSASRSPSNEGSASWPGQLLDPSSSRSPSDTSSVLGRTPSIPENIAINTQGPKTALPPIPSFPPRQTSLARAQERAQERAHERAQERGPRRTTRHPSTESINSSVFDIVDCMSPTTAAASTAHHRNSVLSVEPLSPGQQPPEYTGLPPIYQRATTNGSTSSSMGTITNNHSSSTLMARRPSAQVPGNVDSGLIPVDAENPMPDEQPIPAREPDCSIGPYSSFYKLKGFCKGAEEVMAGRLGFKKIKRPVGGFSMAVVAKCNHCLFEIDFKSVEQDLNNDSSGSFTSNSIGFRLRILQKSHLQIRHVEEQLYGCLFCIQEGKTVEESDATVFFNQSQLFAHLARHPRPLPVIPGLTVVEAPEIPPAFRDNFDLHLPHPPMLSVMVGLSRELSRLPSAIATETRKIQNGVMRSPPGRDPVLHFAIGARIIGIEFPVKYEGKWGIGWHDGVRAAFEADSVQIDAPPKTEIKMQGTSNVQAVARWKWNQKNGDDRWLKFDKGDVIKNIGWAYTDHWCWSGTTSKGWGIFPQSHLDPSSIRTVQPGDTASINSWEKKPRFQISLRKNTERKFGSLGSVTPTSESPPVPSRAGVY